MTLLNPTQDGHIAACADRQASCNCLLVDANLSFQLNDIGLNVTDSIFAAVNRTKSQELVVC